MALRVAIVGAGPAAFYTVEALLARRAAGRDVEIDIIERLPTPYGLIRAGVAPDHQSTKRVAQKFERMALERAVRFFGNVEVGRDVSLEELRRSYDAVVLAVGSPGDRALGVPGENRPGVYGSSLFVGWYNGHPDVRTLDPIVAGPVAVVVGNGNVALDVARILVMSETEFEASDTPDYAARKLRGAGIEEVLIVGRRGPAQARFANAELRELLDLDEAVAIADPADLSNPVEVADERERRRIEKNLALFRRFAAHTGREKPKRIRFRFFAAPTAILGHGAAAGIRLEALAPKNGRLAGSGRVSEVACRTVVTAIGYRCRPLDGVPFDADRGLIPSADGRIEPGLYVVGWAKRGPVGVISSNRPDGEACAAQIEADAAPGDKAGRQALARLLAERGVRPVSFADWHAIDLAEVAAARPPAPRKKFTTLAEMLAILDRRVKAADNPGGGEQGRKEEVSE
ncbi:MAG: FAD-dependent oxidoreductase [Rhodospirillales bacterium]|jgi:ferredoxin--NADP+ reductase|nr:FAD-dependent oxidoreductase [Rhodospirillales bacterium]